MSSLPALKLPAAMIRFWPAAEGGRRGLERVVEEADRAGLARVGELLFAVYPTAGRGALLKDAALWSWRLRQRGSGENGVGLAGPLIFPGWVRQHGPEIEAIENELLRDLDRQPPEAAGKGVCLTSYAARALGERHRLREAGLYRGPSGRGVPLRLLGGETSRPRPWHNLDVLGRSILVERPRATAALEEIVQHPAAAVHGGLGSGKSRALWGFLADRAEPVAWIDVGRTELRESSWAARLAAEIERLTPGHALAPPPHPAPKRLVEWTTEALVRAAEALDVRPWVVFDSVEAMTAEGGEAMALLIESAELRRACRLLVVERLGRRPPSLAVLPQAVIGLMGSGEAEEHRRRLVAGLGMSDEASFAWSEAAAGNPFALEEGLLELTHAGGIRRVYGSFFYQSGGEVEYRASPRWVAQLEAEARRLGGAVALRILAAAGQTVPASELELAAAGLGVELSRDWMRPYLEVDWLEEAEDGSGLAFASDAVAAAFRATLEEGSRAELRHALGRVRVGEGGERARDWSAYRLLAGAPEAPLPLLDMSRDSGDEASRQELYEALSNEWRQHRARGGDEATELDLLWSLLPLGQKLGKLRELEPEIERSLKLADGHPSRHAALLCLRAELDQELGRFGEAEKSLRQALAASQQIAEGRRVWIFLRLGDLLLRRDRIAEAEKIFRDLLEIVDRPGRESLAATCRFYLGNIALRARRFEEALESHRQALSIRRERRLEKQLGASLSALGAVHLGLGDFPRALAYYREAEEAIVAAGGSERELAFAQRGAGKALDRLGEPSAATTPLRRALESCRGRDVVGEAIARLDLGANLLELGKIEPALSETRQAHFQLSLVPEAAFLGDAEQLLGRVQLCRRHEKEARRHFEEALAIHLRHHDRPGAAADLGWLLEVALRHGDRQQIDARGRELSEAVDELLRSSRAEQLFFRLYKACEWLRRRRLETPREPAECLHHAYVELMRKTGFLEPEQRHVFLQHFPEHQEIIDAAVKHGLT